MAEVLETQEQFPVKAGIQLDAESAEHFQTLDPSFRWGDGLVQHFPN
jgi:hypothetical protein